MAWQRLSPETRLAVITGAVNGLVTAVLVGACVLAGFDAANSAARERFDRANVMRTETLTRIRHLEAEVERLHRERE